MGVDRLGPEREYESEEQPVLWDLEMDDKKSVTHFIYHLVGHDASEKDFEAELEYFATQGFFISSRNRDFTWYSMKEEADFADFLKQCHVNIYLQGQQYRSEIDEDEQSYVTFKDLWEKWRAGSESRNAFHFQSGEVPNPFSVLDSSQLESFHPQLVYYDPLNQRDSTHVFGGFNEALRELPLYFVTNEMASGDPYYLDDERVEAHDKVGEKCNIINTKFEMSSYGDARVLFADTIEDSTIVLRDFSTHVLRPSQPDDLTYVKGTSELVFGFHLDDYWMDGDFLHQLAYGPWKANADYRQSGGVREFGTRFSLGRGAKFTIRMKDQSWHEERFSDQWTDDGHQKRAKSKQDMIRDLIPVIRSLVHHHVHRGSVTHNLHPGFKVIVESYWFFEFHPSLLDELRHEVEANVGPSTGWLELRRVAVY